MSEFIPPDKENLRYEYDGKSAKYDAVITKAKDVLHEKINKTKIKIIKFEDRRKNFESFYEKIISHRIPDTYFDKIEDLAGIRIVCLYYSDLDEIAKIIKNNFNVISTKERTFEQRVDKTGYQSNHYLITIPEALVTKSETYLEPEITVTQCEIQVRTALMHAWSAVSHDIFYKKKIHYGHNYDLEMYAISSLFFFADQRFDTYAKLTEEHSETTTNSEINLEQKLTPTSLKEYLANKFPEREISSDSSVYELSTQLNNLNYQTLKDLETMITKTKSILLIYEKDNPMGFTLGTKRDAVGSIRICVAIGDPQNKDSKSFYVNDVLKYRRMIEG